MLHFKKKTKGNQSKKTRVGTNVQIFEWLEFGWVGLMWAAMIHFEKKQNEGRNIHVKLRSS